MDLTPLVPKVGITFHHLPRKPIQQFHIKYTLLNLVPLMPLLQVHQLEGGKIGNVTFSSNCKISSDLFKYTKVTTMSITMRRIRVRMAMTGSSTRRYSVTLP